MKSRIGLKVVGVKNSAVSRLKTTKIGKKLPNGLLRRLESSTTTPQLNITIEVFDIGIGMSTQVDLDGVHSFPNLKIWNEDICIRAHLWPELTYEQTMQLSYEFQELMAKYREISLDAQG